MEVRRLVLRRAWLRVLSSELGDVLECANLKIMNGHIAILDSYSCAPFSYLVTRCIRWTNAKARDRIRHINQNEDCLCSVLNVCDCLTCDKSRL